MVFAKGRDELLNFCNSKGIEAKVHYPIPIYRQPALSFMGHRKGDFPVTDTHANSIISFPCDQHLSYNQIEYVVENVKEFYQDRPEIT